MNTNHNELVAELKLSCILLEDKQTIRFDITPNNEYQNPDVVIATLEMFYNWSSYISQNSELEIIKGARLNKDKLQFVVDINKTR